MSTTRRIAVFCGSSVGNRPSYAAAAREVGSLLARRGLGLVYGGGNIGLMGILADAALAGGGEVIGVIPDALMAKEQGHAGLTELRIVRSMHERKQTMADLADAFLALPGGFGTYEEILEITTWAQLGIHAKAFGLLDVEGFYQPLVAQIDRAVEDGFIAAEQRALLGVGREPEAMIDWLLRARPARFDRWIEPRET